MIQFRPNSFSETTKELPFIAEESGTNLVKRVIKECNYPIDDDKFLDHFQIVINGLKVEKEFWDIITIKESDTVLVAPELKRGDGAQLFKIAAIIAIAVVAPYAAAGLTFTGLAAAGVAAAITIGGSLLLNALIPPPGLPSLGGLGSSEESQMYSITSQSNQPKKYGSVPKVYGRHRIYPILAANPFTEIAPDDEPPHTLIQNFYGLYDFGYGPMTVEDITIGGTPLSFFANKDFKLVDFNKPVDDEGPWDEVLQEELSHYTNEVRTNNITYSLDRNEFNDAGAAYDEYEVIRSAPVALDDAKQEIAINLICPQGLIAYATNGKTSNRTIELIVEFRKVSEPDNWKPFNDLEIVDSYSMPGGKSVYREKGLAMTALPTEKVMTTQAITGYDLLDTAKGQYIYVTDPVSGNTVQKYSVTYTYGIKKRATYFIGLESDIKINDGVFVYGNQIGIISSIVDLGGGKFRYNLKAGVRYSQPLFYANVLRNSPSDTSFYYEYGAYTNYYYGFTSIPSTASESFIKFKYRSLGEVQLVEKGTTPKYFAVKFAPKEIDDYIIKITRTRSYSSATYRVQDALTVLNITTKFLTPVIITDKRHVFLDFKIRATNQINGSVQNLSAVVTSVLDVYDPITQTWSKQPTRNPAWVFCDLLTGEINPKPISKDRLHMESIVEWAEYCDEVPESNPLQPFVQPRFQCDFVLDFNTTLQSIINSVCNAAQASLNIVDGKYGVLIDKRKTVPVQIFTPRNSWDFSSSRSYFDPPHALKVKYVSPEKQWEIDEVIVYADGYDFETASDIQELQSFACTTYEQAWRFGRYMMAQSALRKETISISVDFEHIVCTRGDYVQITQDVMKVGGSPARVKSIVGNRVKIDDGIETAAIPYGYIFRGVAGVEQGTLTVVDSDEFDLTGPLPAVGDLIVIGPVDQVVFDCIVKTITPNDNYSATITLVEKADGVYEAESSAAIPVYDPQLNLIEDADTTPPAVIDLAVTDNTWRVIGSAYQYYIDLDWDVETGVAYELFEIYADSGAGYNLIDYTKESDFEYIVDEDNLGVEHSFKVLAVSASGKKITLLEAPSVQATPVRKITPPSDVTDLYINITNQVIQLEWPRISDPDLKEYLLRYSPRTEGATYETSIPFARISGITNTASVQGRTGTYFVKALDLNNNESVNSAQAITSIPQLFDLNIIEETNDFPDLPGEKQAVQFDGSALVLKLLENGDALTNQYYPEGYYYYENFLDLGEIYTVRLQSLIEAEGFTVDDLMSNWITLDQVAALANAGNADWDVETYYRGTESFNVMADWQLLSDIDPISEGVQDNWTPWRKFIMGDYTFRIAQFRLKLISNVASVTPRVFNGVIKADMPDRFETYNNLISELTPKTILYSPAFKGPGTTPNIQVTIDDSQSGDYFAITNKSLNGFDIIFYDVNNNPVIRQFDIAVLGFGRKAERVI